MNSDINFKQLEYENSNIVVSFDNGTTFKLDKIMTKTNEFFRDLVLSGLSEKLKQIGLGSTPYNRISNNSAWNQDGVEAEILEPQSGEWKKGKVRMRVILEFCPDEPEEIKNDIVQQNGNSLDDIRQTIS